MNKFQLTGRMKEISGIIKEALGRATNNRTLEKNGKLEKATGKMQTSLGDVIDNLKK